MDALDEKFLDQYRSETRQLFHRKLLAALWVGVILIPLFSILDYVVVWEYIRLFFFYRMSCSLAFLVLMPTKSRLDGRLFWFDCITYFV